MNSRRASSQQHTVDTITSDALDDLYRQLDLYKRSAYHRHCLIPGCFREFDSLASVLGDPPARPEWSSEGWLTLGMGTVIPSGGHICPEHADLIREHRPNRAKSSPDGLWGTRCGCGWTSRKHPWHGVLRALWEEHVLQITGEISE